MHRSINPNLNRIQMKGTTLNVIEYQKCNTLRTRTEQFSKINVVLHGHDNIVSALKATYLDNAELLEGDNAYFCGHCGQKQSAKKYCRIDTVPDVMVSNLNRFHYDFSTGERVKMKENSNFESLSVEIQNTVNTPVFPGD